MFMGFYEPIEACSKVQVSMPKCMQVVLSCIRYACKPSLVFMHACGRYKCSLSLPLACIEQLSSRYHKAPVCCMDRNCLTTVC